jgi:putative aldouronate transport system substrate-binding protein
MDGHTRQVTDLLSRADRLTRRRFLARALGLGLSASAASALLAACGSAPTATATTATSSSSSTSSAAATSAAATSKATTSAAAAASSASTTAQAATSAANSSGASSAAAGATPTGGRPNLPSYPAPPAGMYPLTKQKTTFRLLIPANARVKDFPSNAFTAWYEERTGVHIDWEVVPSQDARNKLNVMLSSGDYPDIIMSFNLNAVQQLLYGAQGIFLPLNDYLDKNGLFTKALFEAYPQAREILTAPDGKIYALPQLNDCYQCSMGHKLWIYQPWLDKLGLKMPTTTDEYEQVLQAFKTKDPNGNGQADEIPLLSAVDAQGNQNLDQFLMNAFLFNPGNPWLTLRDGKVTPAYTQPEWRDGLRYLRRLAQQGLLAADSFTQKSAQLQQIGNHPDTPILGSVPGIAPSSFMQIDEKRDSRWTKYASVPPLKGPAGVQYGFYDPYQAYSTGSFIITKACKNPALAFQWADGLYELETTLRNIQGIPDQDWRWAQSGELGVNGKPGVFKRLYAFGNVQNDGWAQSGPSYRTQALRLGLVTGPDVYDQREFLFKATKESIEPHKQPDGLVLPPLYFNQDQATQLANLETTITQYVEQQFVAFVTGKADVEKGWDQYVNTLKNQGLPQYLQIYQAAYDARQKH